MSEIIKIQSLIQKRKSRNCQCKNRRMEIDTTNRIVTCLECGQYIDSINALIILSEQASCLASKVVDKYNKVEKQNEKRGEALNLIQNCSIKDCLNKESNCLRCKIQRAEQALED